MLGLLSLRAVRPVSTQKKGDFHDDIRPNDQRISQVATDEKLTATIALALIGIALPRATLLVPVRLQGEAPRPGRPFIPPI
jgi:hypothetical protein